MLHSARWKSSSNKFAGEFCRFKNFEVKVLIGSFDMFSGAYPLTALVPTYHPPIISRQRTTSPELTSESPENFQVNNILQPSSATF